MSSHCPSITISHNSDYLNLSHMTETAESHILNDGYYLPHHAVMKTTSLTTKLRVVFDGSAATTSGTALNDTLLTGPKIQDDLLYILLRFRNHQYEDLTNLLNAAGLNIRQWASNHPALLQGLAEENLNRRLQLGESSTIKTLGVVWNSSDDSISYAVTTFKSIGTITKRSISSEIAKIYDPLGLLSPVIIVAKILLQKLCTIKVDWDESLPMEIRTEWIQYYHRLPLLNDVVFQRKTIATGAKVVELHGFCDANSTRGPAATNQTYHLLDRLYNSSPLATNVVDSSRAENRNLSSDNAIRHILSGEILIMDKDAASHCILSSVEIIQQREGCPLCPETEKLSCDTIIQLLQRVYFAEEIRCLTKNQTVKGKLQQLNPFLDDDRMLRVDGRLKHSPMPFNQKHPLILPKARITSVIIESEHRAQLHAGVQTTLYAIRRRYWPIDGRSQIWKAIKGCVTCCRAQPPPTNYIMGNLPPSRVTESRPFSNVGVDYCGPFYIKERKRRNRGKIKVYVAVFVCLAVKTTHLELASDLTSVAFIAALRRFIARRGYCTHLYSDNGSNFVGANNELRELRELLTSVDHQNKLSTFLSERSIEWNFIPSQAPHFGGLWEAAVKSFKYHLKRVAGNELFTFENFNTLITEIEAILNSRPLSPISSDANDLLALIPGHFLIGDSLTSLRERDFRVTPSNRLSSWQQIQKIKQHFWNRWRREYLNELTCRHKWATGSHPIKEGTIVLLREDNTPSLQWPLGKIVKIHPGSNGIIRAATVKTATKILDRSIKRLVPLLNQTDDSGSETAEMKDIPNLIGPTKKQTSESHH
ncbi:uncharacterized protein LOC143261733 [Megalopta genalis]|uniref:uncharacterized protein LOC143261733 n=1 Tax=Megalopta genalis TaxID=115081 RepID=UPI003FD14691